MAEQLPTVVFGADGWGYGTTTMLLAVAKRLGGRARRVFVDVSGTTSLAGPAHFEEVVRAESVSAPPTGDLAAELDRAACVVSGMNTPLTWHAHERGVPPVLVEGLGWLWDEPGGGEYRGGANSKPPAPTSRYVVERFLGVDGRVEQWRTTPWGGSLRYEVVGPVLEADGYSWQPGGGEVLVNLGGMGSWLMPEGTRDAYLSLVVHGVLGALPPGHGYRGIRFACGELAAARIRELLAAAGRDDCTAVTLGHADFLDALSRAEFCVSTAGMRTFLEAFTIGVPLAFLPPQNVSHELVLDMMAAEALCAPEVSWRGRGKLGDLLAMSEPDGCAAVNALVDGAGAAGEAEVLAERLRRETRDLTGLTARRQQFVRSLGGDGASRIADVIMEAVGETVPA